MAGVNYVQIVDFISNLTEKFADVDTDLPIHEQHLSKLRERLGMSNYTFLQIKDGSNVEIIKVSSFGGKLSVTRGLETTVAKTFPKGSCVQHILTSTAVRDIVCQMDCCP